MTILNIFDPKTTAVSIERIEKLTPETQPLWGTMSVAQMMAHVCVSYELAFGIKVSKPNPLMKVMLKLLVKPIVVGEKEYKKNGRTAPNFVISDQREFETEKQRLINFIKETEEKGASYFEGKSSDSFGKMTAAEWNNQFYKHLDHHLRQFGV